LDILNFSVVSVPQPASPRVRVALPVEREYRANLAAQPKLRHLTSEFQQAFNYFWIRRSVPNVGRKRNPLVGPARLGTGTKSRFADCRHLIRIGLSISSK
jgi:hypothetical protein